MGGCTVFVHLPYGIPSQRRGDYAFFSRGYTSEHFASTTTATWNIIFKSRWNSVRFAETHLEVNMTKQLQRVKLLLASLSLGTIPCRCRRDREEPPEFHFTRLVYTQNTAA